MASGMKAFDHDGNLLLELGAEPRPICISCGVRANNDGTLPCDH
ncbi:hypothetical protein PSP31120_01527 [Pandoraea sputorum]|nr:hypothetical protein PSP31120_01527 [Pandoraea sputorum]